MAIIQDAEVLSTIGLEAKLPYQAFRCADPFNPGNELAGWIRLKPDAYYGSLIITEVNNWKTTQFIYGTPKLHYPVDKEGRWSFLQPINKLAAWEKLDGTNIVAYRYYNKLGREFITYKTRLTPVLKSGSFGDFVNLWQECLTNQPEILEAIKANSLYNLSFELHGYKNPVTIEYQFPLKATLLFGIDLLSAQIIPLPLLKHSCPTPKQFTINEATPLSSLYYELRIQMTKENQTSFSHEGLVFYVQPNEQSGWIMLKCKPEQIEKLHWANGAIQESAIWNTIINAYENFDTPTALDIEKLLAEEFNANQIGLSKTRIEKLRLKAIDHMQLNQQIQAAIALIADSTNKPDLLRQLSKHFPKSVMRKVGSIIMRS